MSIVAAYAVPHPPLILPDVGKGDEAGIQATIDAYREVARRIVEHDPDVIVVSSPHAPMYRNCFHISSGHGARGDMTRYLAPRTRVEVDYDEELTSLIIESAQSNQVPVVTGTQDDAELDHASLIPLWFVNQEHGSYKVVRLGISGLPADDHRTLGRCIADAAAQLGRRVVYIASGDLSHKLREDGPYGFVPEGPVFDERIGDIFADGTLSELFEIDPVLSDTAAECGLRSFQIMAGALETENTRLSHELLSYEGPFGVGYAVAAFEEVDPHVDLARATVESYVRTGHGIERPRGLSPDITDMRAGVFVSLHKGPDLRGCIGTIAPTTDCVADEVIANAIAACNRDPRFNPVSEDELDYLSYSVDVLSEPSPIESVSELDPARYGVIVTRGLRRGLLLPNLEGIDDADQQIAIAKRKAGISAGESVDLERFEVVRHERGGGARRARS